MASQIALCFRSNMLNYHALSSIDQAPIMLDSNVVRIDTFIKSDTIVPRAGDKLRIR